MNDHKCPDDNYYRAYSDFTWDAISCDENGNLNCAPSQGQLT